jgi:hypothetical protein
MFWMSKMEGSQASSGKGSPFRGPGSIWEDTSTGVVPLLGGGAGTTAGVGLRPTGLFALPLPLPLPEGTGLMGAAGRPPTWGDPLFAFLFARFIIFHPSGSWMGAEEEAMVGGDVGG